MTDTTTYKLSSPAIYVEGATRFAKRHNAVIAWGDDGKIKLYLAAPDDPTTVPAFDVTPDQIEKVGGATSQLTFTIGGKKWRIELFTGTYATPDVAMPINPGGRIVDMISEAKKTDVREWVDELKKANVNVTYMNTGKLFVVAGAITVGIIVVVSIFVLLTSQW